MQINLPSEVANAALAIAASRGYGDVAEYIAELVKRENEAELTKPRSEQNSAQWCSRLREWAASHPATDHFVDANRESIYGDRGL